MLKDTRAVFKVGLESWMKERTSLCHLVLKAISRWRSTWANGGSPCLEETSHK